MHYADLTPYAYSHDDYIYPNNARSVMNVGWLEPSHPFATGPASDVFLDSLFALCENPVNKTRGFHICPYCDGLPAKAFTIPGTRIQIQLPDQIQAASNGKKLWLGSAEIRACGQDDIWYAAPNMIYHYVAVHAYLPPAAFIEAVLATQRNQTNPF